MCSCILWTYLQSFSVDGLAVSSQCSDLQLSQSLITSTAASWLSLYTKCVCSPERGLFHTNNSTVSKKTLFHSFQWDHCSGFCVTEETHRVVNQKSWLWHTYHEKWLKLYNNYQISWLILCRSTNGFISYFIQWYSNYLCRVVKSIIKEL